MHKTDNNQSHSIMFFIWGGIGNMVMALPMLNAASRGFPGGLLTVVVQNATMLSLLEGNDRFVKLAMGSKEFSGVFGKLKLIKKTREQHPEVTISTVPSPKMRSGVLALLSGSGKRICSNQYGSSFCNIKIEGKPEERHYIYKNLSLLSPVKIESSSLEYGIRIPLKYNQKADEFFEGNKISQDKKTIGIHPGAGNRQKRWPAEKFTLVGKELAGKGYKVIIFGGPDEVELIEQVASGIGPEAFRFAGNNDLSATLGMINKCDAFISNDSGLAHCAAALGVATVVVFGPTDPDICAPIAPNVRIVRNNLRCAPCYRPSNKFRCNNYPPQCFDIPTELVLKEIAELVEGGGNV